MWNYSGHTVAGKSYRSASAGCGRLQNPPSGGKYFARIKQFRRIATRYEKTDTSFAGMIDLVATVIAIMR